MMFLSAVVFVILVKDSSCVGGKQQTVGLQVAPNSGVPNYQELNLPFEQVKYSVAKVSKEYNSSTKHHAPGMGHLYLITKSFMNLIFPGELYPEGNFKQDFTYVNITYDLSSTLIFI